MSSLQEDNTVRIFNDDRTDTYGCFALRIFEPITLTEGWLLKFGFRKSNEKLYFLPIPNLVMEIHAVFFRESWLIELSNDRKNIVTEVLKVHQLQNLYFALTGTELTYETES